MKNKYTSTYSNPLWFNSFTNSEENTSFFLKRRLIMRLDFERLKEITKISKIGRLYKNVFNIDNTSYTVVDNSIISLISNVGVKIPENGFEQLITLLNLLQREDVGFNLEQMYKGEYLLNNWKSISRYNFNNTPNVYINQKAINNPVDFDTAKKLNVRI